jgi:hypothetical protein
MNAMKKKLLFLILTIFCCINSFAQSVAHQPADIIQCSNEVFDLTQQTPQILDGQDPQFFVVTYFVSTADAENNINPITNPHQFVSNGQQQTIFARVDSLSDDSYDTTQFTISWISWEDIMPNLPTPLEVCDDFVSQNITVDLTSKIYEITDGNTDLFVTFHENEADASAGTFAIPNPENYTHSTPDSFIVWVRVVNVVTGCFGIVVLEVAEIECTDNTVSGTLTFDMEDNDCASGTTPGAYIMMALTHNNDVYYTYTDANGNYTFTNVPDGENYVYVAGQGPFTFAASPASYTVTTPGELTGNNFCLEEPAPANDAVIIITPWTNPRPGFPVSYNVMVYNAGNTTLNGNVTVQFDDTKLTYVSSGPAMTVTGNTLTIPYTNLAPLTSQVIVVNFTVMEPPTVVQGTVITITGNVTPLDGDILPLNNEYICTRIATNSMDPNDITCREGLYITEEQADEYLHYVIRFQNTGDDEAVFIRVENILDEKFDPATFQPIGSSHDYRVEMLNNEVKFIFEDINLPGTDDEPNSHGFIAYRIKARSSVQLEDKFEATASIYFDFNEAIVTNTAETTIQNVAGIEEAFANAFVVYPNPASHIVNIRTNDISANAVNMSIANVLGKTVMSNTLQMQGNVATLDISSLNSGIYFVTIEAEGKLVTKKLVIK